MHDADGVSDEVMLAFAKETRLVETTFVQSSEAADYRNRIWTPAEEIPFAGHPSLGTAVAVALERGEDEVEYRQQTHAGIQPVRVQPRRRPRLRVDPAGAGRVRRGGRSGRDPGAIGLGPEDAHPSLAPQHVSTGLATLIAPLASADAVSRARKDQAAVAALADGTFNLYLCAIDGDSARARSFPSELEGEDPATGSAAGPLMAYANVRLGAQRLEVTQGVEMGRPSRLLARDGGRAPAGGRRRRRARHGDACGCQPAHLTRGEGRAPARPARARCRRRAPRPLPSASPSGPAST